MEWEAGDALYTRAKSWLCILPAGRMPRFGHTIATYGKSANHFFRLTQVARPLCQLGVAFFSDLCDDLRGLGYQYLAGCRSRTRRARYLAGVVECVLGCCLPYHVVGFAMGQKIGRGAGSQRVSATPADHALSG